MSTGESATLSPSELSDLESALLDYKQSMLARNVAPEDVRVVITSDLREAISDQEWPLFLKRMEQKLGRIIEVTDSIQEAGYLYVSTLCNVEGMNERQKNLVVEIGESTVRLVFGKGPRSIESALTTAAGILPLGSATIDIEDVFGPIDTALGREAVRSALLKHLIPETRYAAKGRVIYLTGEPTFDLFTELESQRPDGGPDTAKDLRNDGLTVSMLDWYLGPEGLNYLQHVAGKKRDSEAAVRLLIIKLIMLRELLTRLGAQKFFLGGAGGQEAGMLDEVVRGQITRRVEGYGRALHCRYRREYPAALRILRNVFPDFKIRGRVKDGASIADKLLRKALRTGARKQNIRTLEEAGRLIGDGHGLRLVLNSTSRAAIERVREQLIQGIRDGLIQVLEINNFHAGETDALPYLAEEDIARIRMAAEKARGALPQKERPQSVNVLDGPGATKPSGYTTTQINIRMRNPVSEQFDLVCELQIRGAEVERFSAAEHLIHDFRRGKDPYKKSEPIRRLFEPEVSPLLRAIQEMSDEKFGQFTDYLSRFYLHYRRLENGQVVPEPELPEGLPEVCHVENIKRLSHMQKQLITRYRQRPVQKPSVVAGGPENDG